MQNTNNEMVELLNRRKAARQGAMFSLLSGNAEHALAAAGEALTADVHLATLRLKQFNQGRPLPAETETVRFAQ